MNSRDRSKNWILDESGKNISLSLRGLHRNSRTLSVIPNEREGSKTDFSLRSKQGFLAAVEMTNANGHGISAIMTQPFERERENSHAEGIRPCSN
jgi:hypothetical protein